MKQLKLEPHDGMPRTLISVGDAETLHDDILAFAARLENVTPHRAKDMPHNPLLFAYSPRSARSVSGGGGVREH
ncbi:MAG: hypothetical protein ACO1OB_03520 [Archangium sp.]